MEKLELKHLQAYKLGENGVKVLLTNYAKLEIAIENVDLSERFYISNIDFESETICIIAESGYEIDTIPLGYIKPLLYPLSDITKEIDYNGEKITPYNWIAENYPNCGSFSDWFKEYQHIAIKDSLVEYCVVQKLLEWHFDVFNLIENGLAIDVNTL